MGLTEDIQRLRRERDAARADAQSLRVRLLQVEIELGALKQIVADAVERQQQAKSVPPPAPAPSVPAPPAPTREQSPIGPRLLRMREVKVMVGLHPSTLYRRIAAKQFPPPIRLGLRSVAWREADILEWQQALATGVHQPDR